ncbi:tetratricopeptide repeat protein [Polycladidibacter stylochi]|uniref:tetratricopeptide repeat protein n=1 Tax=Polycladidibacter stylochi TaxID=1807766 RepID=UPI000829BC6A|nr:tetratricopeptide repeat protein [Pseudovibrio stylochi]
MSGALPKAEDRLQHQSEIVLSRSFDLVISPPHEWLKDQLQAIPKPPEKQEVPAASKPTFEELSAGGHMPAQHGHSKDEVEQLLNAQFQALKDADTTLMGKRIATDIRRLLGLTGDAAADLLMKRSNLALKQENYTLALDLLNHATLIIPQNAEVWNRRASVHYRMDNYSLALRDLHRALYLEPRHFSAIYGLASINMQLDQHEHALQLMKRLLAIYPTHVEAQEAVKKLRNVVWGEWH